MFKIITLIGPPSQRKTHIAKGVRKGKLPKNSLCGKRFKWTCIKSVKEGYAEMCSCQKCINILNSNVDLFME